MKRQHAILLVALITLFGAALRFYRLNVVPLRGDEAFTVIHWMREPLGQTLENIVTVDPQGLFNYVLYRAYALVVGSQEQVVRFLPALFSIIGIPILYALGARLWGRRGGLLAAFLWAIHPFVIWHAQDARSYAIWSVTNPLALWLAFRALHRGQRIDWILYVAAAALSLYVYYLEIFTVAALNLYVLFAYWRRRPTLIRWIGAQVAVVLLVAPWYLQERLLSGGGYSGTTFGFDVERLFKSFLPTLVYGEVVPFSSVMWVLLLIVLVVAFVALFRTRLRTSALLLALLLIPLIALSVVSLRMGVFSPRYVLSVSVIFVLVISGVLTLFSGRNLWFRLLGVVFVGSQFLALIGYVYDYAKSPDWRSLSHYLAGRVSPTDYLVQAAADESFTFYCSEYNLSPDCDQKLPANPRQTVSEIESVLTMRSETSTGIWYVARPMPDWANASAALDWLNANLQPVRSAELGTLPAYQFMPYEVREGEIASDEPLAVFSDTVELVGVRWWREPDDTLLVWLYWQPLKQTGAPLKIFLHLLNNSGIAAQDDQPPQDGRLTTTGWGVGEPFRDIYHLPLNGAAPGDYTLAIGLYNPDTNERVPLEDGSDAYLMLLPIPLPH